MKLSDAIKQLQAFKKEHGDIPIVYSGYDTYKDKSFQCDPDFEYSPDKRVVRIIS